MAFAINVLVRGREALKSTFVAVRENLVGAAAAEERLARAGQTSLRAQEKLARATKARVDAERAGMRTAAMAAGKVGGAGGAVAGRVAGALGMGGGMGAVALGAAGLGLAFQVVTSAAERAAEHINQVAEAHANLRQAVQGQVQQANATAIGSAKGNRAALLGLAAGGPDALARAEDLMRKVGPGGLEAAGKMQANGLFNESTTDALMRAVATGQITPEAFADTLTKHRGLAKGRSPNQMAQAVIGKAGGGRVDVAATNAALRNDPLAQRFGQLDAVEGNNEIAAIQRFAANPMVLAELATQAGRTTSPEAAAALDQLKVQEEQLRVLRDMSSQQGYLYKAFLDLVTPGGSADTQQKRLRGAVADAAIGVGG